MAKAKKTKKTTTETLEDLAELAGRLNMPDDALDGELSDACDDSARLQLEYIRGCVTLEKLEFLRDHGYQIGRLKELIEEASKSE